MSRDRNYEDLVFAERACEALWLIMIIIYVIITIISFRWAFEKLIIMIKEVFFLIFSSEIALIIRSILINVWSEKVIIEKMCDVFSIKEESS